MATDYVPIEPELQLPPHLKAAEARARQFDPELRLRQSANPALRRAGLGYILERRTRYTPPVTTETVKDEAGNYLKREDIDVKIASRDGYLVIAPVHISLLMRPDSIVERLKPGDLATQTAEQRYQEIVNAELEAKANRRKFRRGELSGYYRESFDVLDRVGDSTSHAERMRLNNAGGVERFNITDRRRIKPADLETLPSTGETPVKELSDEHTPGTSARREDGRLHDQAAGGQAGDRLH
jgi:hypothetical protein